MIEGSPSDKPSPRRPEDTTQWKVTCDARGSVAVREYGVPLPTLIGTATWNGSLSDFRQEQQLVPSDVKWTAIETAIRRELENAAARGAAEDTSLVEQLGWFERRDLYPRSSNWKAMGPRYDRNGVDRYFMRKVKWVIAIVLLIMTLSIVIGMVVWQRGRSRDPGTNHEVVPVRPTTRSPIVEQPDP